MRDTSTVFQTAGLTPLPCIIRHHTNTGMQTGSPATCVNLAIHQLESTRGLSRTDILVCSGPNIGHNSGLSAILSSGTVGGSLEGALLGVKSISLSFPFFKGFNNWTQGEVDSACEASLYVIKDLWGDWDSSQDTSETVYNINTPIGATLQTEVRHTTVETRCVVTAAGFPFQILHSTVLIPYHTSRACFPPPLYSPASRYSSLYAPDTASNAADTDKAASPAWESAKSTTPQDVESPAVYGTETYVWKPTGVRAFDSADLTEGSDVDTVKRGMISISRLPLRGILTSQ